MIAAAVFYVFAFVLILSALFVVGSKNPVHSVLFLILAFFNAAGLFVLLGAEFIAFILAIVYVGAVAVLFLFVVMMLDMDLKELRKGIMQYVPLGLLIGGVLLVQLFLVASLWPQLPQAGGAGVIAAHPENTKALGAVLYTRFLLPFQLSGLILLVAMVGAICLTLRRRPGVKRQNVTHQVSTKASKIVTIQRVETGKGVQIP